MPEKSKLKAETLKGEGNTLFQSGKWQLAAAKYEAASGLDPSNPVSL